MSSGISLAGQARGVLGHGREAGYGILNLKRNGFSAFKPAEEDCWRLGYRKYIAGFPELNHVLGVVTYLWMCDMCFVPCYVSVIGG